MQGAPWIHVALPLSAGLRPAALTAFATLPRRGGRVRALYMEDVVLLRSRASQSPYGTIAPCVSTYTA